MQAKILRILWDVNNAWTNLEIKNQIIPSFTSLYGYGAYLFKKSFFNKDTSKHVALCWETEYYGDLNIGT